MQPIDHIDVSEVLQRPGVGHLLSVCRDAGATARIVGGAVRDLLLERPVGDIDIAIDTPPAETKELLQRAGIATLDYGFSHGTVPALVEHEVIELTSLRVDVKTHGRHAEVAFTDDWLADAERRDLTMNALYLDADGALYDPCDGYGDLKSGHVRFVGDPVRRIAEDRLRILRYFRFLAWYGQTGPEPAALAACQAAAAQIPQLSGERIHTEMCKLLTAPEPIAVLRLMIDTGVLGEVIPGTPDLGGLERLLAAESAAEVPAAPIRRLAALLSEAGQVAAVAGRWRLSRDEAARLAAAATPSDEVRAAAGQSDARLLLYRAGEETALDCALLAGDVGLARRVAATPVPEFHLGGRDVLRLGMPAGPAVGDMLQAVEAWWIEGDFQADREALLSELRRRLDVRGGASDAE